jgi:transcription termination factor Rho
MDETQTQQRSMLAGKLVSELQAIAEQVGVRDAKKRKKADLIDAILGTVKSSNGSATGTHDAGSSNGAGSMSGKGEPSRAPEGERGRWAHEAGSGGESGHDRPAPDPVPAAQAALAAQAAPVYQPAPGAGSPEPSPAPSQDAARPPAPAGTAAEHAAGQDRALGPEDPEVAAAPGSTGRNGAAPGSDPGATTAAPPSEAPAEAPARGRDGSDGPAPAGSATGQAESSTGTGPGSPSGDGWSPATAHTATEPRPDFRRDTQREGDSTRERGRRRRRRERTGERLDRPAERGERVPERLDRGERYERPRREPEAEDTSDLEVRTGILDVLPEGYGFLRTSGYLPGQEDVYVSLSQVRRAQLRRGDEIAGAVRRPKEGEKYPALIRIDSVNGMVPEEIIGRKWFEKLTPLYPEERLHMELAENPGQIAQRIIDLVAPIGKGQRGMIVSPPKAGKTTIMKQIANSITSNNPECHLIVLLVDERPEEVTDMQRSVKGEIVYSTFDRPSEDHIQATELTLDRAKRLVELGRDVVILLDGITRLSRAYNLATPASGRILSGGVDSTALYPPKRFFGAARNIEQGGSLTIIATALVETGSRMDEVIFEEFKGTGNWELRLDRRASEKRIFPAIDIQASGTRKEELLLSPEELALVWKLRRVLHALEAVAALELLVDKMRQTKGNMQFLREIQKVQIGD